MLQTWIDRLPTVGADGRLLVLMVVVFGNVVMRYAFTRTTLFEELSRWLFV